MSSANDHIAAIRDAMTYCRTEYKKLHPAVDLSTLAQTAFLTELLAKHGGLLEHLANASKTNAMLANEAAVLRSKYEAEVESKTRVEEALQLRDETMSQNQEEARLAQSQLKKMENAMASCVARLSNAPAGDRNDLAKNLVKLVSEVMSHNTELSRKNDELHRDIKETSEEHARQKNDLRDQAKHVERQLKDQIAQQTELLTMKTAEVKDKTKDLNDVRRQHAEDIRLKELELQHLNEQNMAAQIELGEAQIRIKTLEAVRRNAARLLVPDREEGVEDNEVEEEMETDEVDGVDDDGDSEYEESDADADEDE